MARIYRAKVTELARALQEPDSRSEATEALRGLVDAIVLTPDQRRRDASDRVEGESGGHAGGDRTNEEVAGIRRPLPASIFGCGGAQPTLSAALATGGLRFVSDTFRAFLARRTTMRRLVFGERRRQRKIRCAK